MSQIIRSGSIVLILLLGSFSSLWAVEKRTISRDDHIYAAFPDVALTPHGILVDIYRECMGHAPFPFSRIAVRRSLDGGNQWSDRTILLETVASAEQVDKARSWLAPDALAGYEKPESHPGALAEGCLYQLSATYHPGRRQPDACGRY